MSVTFIHSKKVLCHGQKLRIRPSARHNNKKFWRLLGVSSPVRVKQQQWPMSQRRPKSVKDYLIVTLPAKKRFFTNCWSRLPKRLPQQRGSYWRCKEHPETAYT